MTSAGCPRFATLLLLMSLLPFVVASPATAAAEGPFVSAHRGGAAYAPENTMVAFRNAVRLGVDGIITNHPACLLRLQDRPVPRRILPPGVPGDLPACPNTVVSTDAERSDAAARGTATSTLRAPAGDQGLAPVAAASALAQLNAAYAPQVAQLAPWVVPDSGRDELETAVWADLTHPTDSPDSGGNRSTR